MPSAHSIRHFNQWKNTETETAAWLDLSKNPLRVGVTSGASCPDALVDEVILQILSWIEGAGNVDDALAPFRQHIDAITT
jgi:4-hydroxy-3-methylbut-2-enyl diphosphate reductase